MNIFGKPLHSIPTLTNNFHSQFLISFTIPLSESIPTDNHENWTTYSGGQIPAFIRFFQNKKKNTNLHKRACQIYEINMQRNMCLFPQIGRKKWSEHNCQASNLLKQKTTTKNKPKKQKQKKHTRTKDSTWAAVSHTPNHLINTAVTKNCSLEILLNKKDMIHHLTACQGFYTMSSPKLLTLKRGTSLWHGEWVLKKRNIFQANSSWLDEIHKQLSYKIFKIYI